MPMIARDHDGARSNYSVSTEQVLSAAPGTLWAELMADWWGEVATGTVFVTRLAVLDFPNGTLLTTGQSSTIMGDGPGHALLGDLGQMAVPT